MPGIPERKNRPNTPSLSEPSLLFFAPFSVFGGSVVTHLAPEALCHSERSEESPLRSLHHTNVTSVINQQMGDPSRLFGMTVSTALDRRHFVISSEIEKSLTISDSSALHRRHD